MQKDNTSILTFQIKVSSSDINIMASSDLNTLSEALGISTTQAHHVISPQNINSKDDSEDTVLHRLVDKQCWHAIPLLLQHGADVNVADRVGTTPFAIAVMYKQAPTKVMLICLVI